MLTQREKLIERLLRLPDPHVETIWKFMDGLECQLELPSQSSQSILIPEIEGNQSGNELPHSKDWPHAPTHRLSDQGTYFVTAGTMYKQHFFRGPDRLGYLEGKLLTLAKQYGWQLEAWAVFSNHYHFVAHALESCSPLDDFVKRLHGETATEMNHRDDELTRQVWFNYWDTQLTFEKSYLARLNYAHQNAVKHGLVRVANQYPWCSAAWFERTARPAQVRAIYSFKTEKISIRDDFQPVI